MPQCTNYRKGNVGPDHVMETYKASGGTVPCILKLPTLLVGG